MICCERFAPFADRTPGESRKRLTSGANVPKCHYLLCAQITGVFAHVTGFALGKLHRKVIKRPVMSLVQCPNSARTLLAEVRQILRLTPRDGTARCPVRYRLDTTGAVSFACAVSCSNEY